MPQAVNMNELYNYKQVKTFSMIDNYIYLEHIDTLIALPLYPESITDSMSISYSPQDMLMRSAPIYSYTHSGPRSFEFTLPLHRDMMNQINTSASLLNIPKIDDEDYVDLMIRQLQAAALPRYSPNDKMVNPPIVAVRFGDSLFCKGVVNGPVRVEHKSPILVSNKYASVTVSFGVSEIDPYDADSVVLQGGFRGLRTTLERRIYKQGG